MSSATDHREISGLARENHDKFSAVVVYEDDVTRDRAMSISDRLVNKFWTDMEFEFEWWRFDFLRDPQMANEAARAAARSDLVLFSAHAEKRLPSSVRRWIDIWLTHRSHQHGVLVAMIGTTQDQLRGMTPIHVYLHEVAGRAGMDYLPQMLNVHLDASMEGITRRAEKVTMVLDNILHGPADSPRWGINE